MATYGRRSGIAGYRVFRILNGQKGAEYGGTIAEELARPAYYDPTWSFATPDE